jgi:hypothetical protein
MKKTVVLKITLFFVCSTCYIINGQEILPQEHIKKVMSLIQKDASRRACYTKDTNLSIHNVLPLKRMSFQTPFYKDIIAQDISTEWIIVAYTTSDTVFYRYNMWKIEYVEPACKQNILNIFNTNNGFISYLPGQRTGLPPLHADIFFFVKPNKNNIVLQNLCTNKEYSMDSLILIKYGSYKKYIEVLQEDLQKEENDKLNKLAWLDAPKTIQDAYNIIKSDYNEYFNCYPHDTITATLMLIDDIIMSTSIDTMQKHLLTQRVFGSIKKFNEGFTVEQFSNPDYIFILSFTLLGNNKYGVSIGQLNFYDIVESVLTKSQMDKYKQHRQNQQNLVKYVRSILFPEVRINCLHCNSDYIPNDKIRWNNYINHKDKYKDEKDFLRKEVFKKSE